jgi:hypothetical protein
MGLEVWLVLNREGIPVALHGGAADAWQALADQVTWTAL